MHYRINRLLWMFIFITSCYINSFSQISPGELSKFHTHLEGMGKCTQCHILGAKVSNSKCLTCHTEINDRIKLQKGYHSSPAVKGKECASCHSDHHGKNFQIVRFEEAKFQHSLTGYTLEGAHSRKKCNDCHKPESILNQKIKAKTYTYLGLSKECLSCHADYHQKTLSGTCLNCHSHESFKPAAKFNHATTKFPLVGKHQNVECLKCHKIETKEGKKFQNFTGIPHNSCTNCHTDVHQNKFGQDCRKCHSENSFHEIKSTKNFDHNKTGFPLEGEHSNVSCISCHKANYSNSIKHAKCSDCHTDYHSNQFAKSGVSPDCSKCHTVKGFTPSNYTLQQHNQSEYKLKGAHIAAPCFECHKKTEKWKFRGIGKQCTDCHKNIHQTTISQKYYPNESCTSCHTENKWSEISFDHSQTDFQLTGVHSNTSCRSCHFVKGTQGHEQHKFIGSPKTCTSCHADKHNKQFERNGITNCTECHGTDNWKASKFDHNKTAFKLDGKHQTVPCAQCHKPNNNEKYVLYKINKFKCESCHLP